MDGCFPAALAFAMEAMVRVEGKRDCGETGRAKWCGGGAVRGMKKGPIEKYSSLIIALMSRVGRDRMGRIGWCVHRFRASFPSCACRSLPGASSLGLGWARGDEPLVPRLLF